MRAWRSATAPRRDEPDQARSRTTAEQHIVTQRFGLTRVQAERRDTVRGQSEGSRSSSAAEISAMGGTTHAGYNRA